VQREPLGAQPLGAMLGVSEDQINAWLALLEDLLRFQRVPNGVTPSSKQNDWRISVDHVSLEQWLTERSGGRRPLPRAGRFAIHRDQAWECLHTWARAEVDGKRAHTWPYLVRHLASHLSDDERPALVAGLLGQFPWLEARLRLAGLNALLADFALAEPSPGLFRLERALQQGAHVLGPQQGWSGQEQLASQLLARLSEDGESLVAHDALRRT